MVTRVLNRRVGPLRDLRGRRRLFVEFGEYVACGIGRQRAYQVVGVVAVDAYDACLLTF